MKMFHIWLLDQPHYFFTVRHPPSKIPNSCKTNRLMLFIGFS